MSQNLLLEFFKIDVYREESTGFRCRRFENIIEQLKDKGISYFKIVWTKELGRDFYAPKKFVEEIENMLLHFYAGVVQNLSAYRQPSPKMITNSESSQESERPLHHNRIHGNGC